MRVKELKEMLDKLPDGAEVVVRSDSKGRDHEVEDCYVVPFDSRYFGGPEPTSKESNCLVLLIL